MISDEKALCLFHVVNRDMFVRKVDIIFFKSAAPVESLMIQNIKTGR